MKAAFFAIIGFAFGSIPFAVLLGRRLIRTDIRSYGDHNPGAANAWRAGGWQLGLVALLLDYGKGALPIGLARTLGGISGPELIGVGLAPIAGHAFSPFLKFRGGKALAVTFGVWTGLMLAEGPLVLGLLFGFFYFLQDVDGLAVILGMLAFTLYLWLRGAESDYLLLAAGNLAILMYRHWQALRKPRFLNPILRKAFRGTP